ncbi:MAG: hypothetical protein KC493_06615 [Bacteriovoracaceae bacterium]|nr:hypothetical protein [Bacteriovoracaceae bacterium]
MLLFLGRGWQHFFWDAPFRTVLWNEDLLKGLIEGLTSMTWKEYVTSPIVDGYIQGLTRAFGVFYFLMGIVVIFVSENSKKMGKLLLLGSASLMLLVFLMFMEKFFYIGMFIEHALQMGAPLVLYIALYKDNFFNRNQVFFKVLIAMTFIGHAMFAIGIHPVPGPFIDMIINVFGSSESQARSFLILAGSLDILFSILLFFQKTEVVALAFSIGWGLTTAMARIVAHVDHNLIGMSSHQWVMETLYRFPHGLIPLAMFLYLMEQKKAGRTGQSISLNV